MSPDYFKMQKICERVIEDEPETLGFVLDHLKTKKICEKVVEKYPYNLKIVPDHLKTQQMCNKAVRMDPWFLQYVPNWFVTQKQIKIWYKNFKLYEAEWYEGYQKRKALKASIKEELLPIAWHPSRWWD